jgi:hypothetical protein
MAFVSFTTIIGLLSGSAEKRNDEENWSVDIEQSGEPRRKGEVTAVSLEAQGLNLTIKDGDKEIELAALPHKANKVKVLVDGELDPDAVLVFAFKGSFGNPSRWGFDFKRVTIDDEDYRFNCRFDP